VITEVIDSTPGLADATAARPAQFGNAEADVDIIANDVTAARPEKPNSELRNIVFSLSWLG
jgi:hypothetical protein